LLVGGDAADPSIVYTIDYRWGDDAGVNDFDVLLIHGSTATLLSRTTIHGWVGSTFVSGKQAYLSAQQYIRHADNTTSSKVELHAIDLSNPSHPCDRIASEQGCVQKIPLQ